VKEDSAETDVYRGSPALLCRAMLILKLSLLFAIAPVRAEANDWASLRAADNRLASAAYRLSIADISLCPTRVPVTGLVLHELGQYPPRQRAAAAAAFTLGRGIGVISVVPDSPAARAGIAPNDEILSIDGKSVVQAVPGTLVPASFDRMERTLAILRGAGPEIRLDVSRGGSARTFTIIPMPGCAADVVLLPSHRRNAWADGTYVVVTTAMLDFVRNDDELAFVVAHELAHDILGHRDRLDAAGVPRGLLRSLGVGAKRVRETEIEADRFAVRLMAAAGYRPAAAVEFWSRFARGVEFPDPTHPPRDARIAALKVEVEAVGSAASSAPDGAAPK
jgi:Zn-dependent protease with chaperone function